ARAVGTVSGSKQDGGGYVAVGPLSTQPAGPLGIPGSMLRAYKHAQTLLAASDPGCHLPWWLLAGIGRIESGHARGGQLDAEGTTLSPILGPVLNGTAGNAMIPDTDSGIFDHDTTWDRAVGPMQFIPSTWRRYAVDAHGGGAANPNNAYDATAAAGRYLCAGGGDLADPAQRAAAVFRYNHSDSYVSTVLTWANAYAHGVTPLTDAPPRQVAGPAHADRAAAGREVGVGHGAGPSGRPKPSAAPHAASPTRPVGKPAATPSPTPSASTPSRTPKPSNPPATPTAPRTTDPPPSSTAPGTGSVRIDFPAGVADAGDSGHLTGAGFTPAGVFTFSFVPKSGGAAVAAQRTDGKPGAVKVTANHRGAFTGTIRIPRTLTAGHYLLRVSSADGATLGSVPLTLAAATPATTGSGSPGLLGGLLGGVLNPQSR
ncbi:MAG: lytic murein transglycosylase, partial [Sciscionella sp.]